MKSCKRFGKLMKGLLVLLCAMLLTGCAGQDAMTMEEAAGEFAAGKQEVEYIPLSAEDLLMAMLDDFSGSYNDPVGRVVDPDEFDDIRRRIFGDEEEDDSSQGQTGQDQSGQGQTGQDQSGQGQTGQEQPDPGPAPSDYGKAESDTDLDRILYEAIRDTEQYIVFSSSIMDGDRVLQELESIYNDLQRKDPINICCLYSYTVSYGGGEVSILLEYTLDRKELIKIKQETPALVRKAAAAVGAKGTDYDKVYRLNEYLCDTVYYPPKETVIDPNKPMEYPPIAHTAYGALNNGCAVCEGYACAAALILRELGVEADIEVGNTAGGGHAWNLVKVDGDWYQLDVTWNDCGAGYNPDASMVYFLVTDDFMKESRIWEEDNYPHTPAVPYTI